MLSEGYEVENGIGWYATKMALHDRDLPYSRKQSTAVDRKKPSNFINSLQQILAEQTVQRKI